MPSPPPLWELGALGLLVSQQAYPGADQQVQRQLVLPYLTYRGQVVRAERDNAGLRALKAGNLELDLGVSAALGSNAGTVEARRGMADLGTLVELGPRLRWTFHLADDGSRWRLDLPLRGVVSLSDGLAHRGMAFEPEIKWQGLLAGGWFVNTGVSVVLGDRRLASTYYGVPAGQATLSRPAYAAQSGLISTRLSVAAGRRIAPQWNAFVYGRIDSVEGAANQNSPLVRQTTGATVGVGVAYVWKQSAEPAMP